MKQQLIKKSYRFPAELLTRIENYARRRNIKMSRAIRELLEKSIQRAEMTSLDKFAQVVGKALGEDPEKIKASVRSWPVD